MFENLQTRITTFHSRYERYIPIAGFFTGFIFDMLILERIDEPKVILQQAIYLLVACALITVDLFEFVREAKPPTLLRRVWKYREFVMHFVLGTLLNSYTIFYFKSASGITSFIFIFLLIAALTLAEFKRFGKFQHQVHMALWSLCLVSYFQSLIPILVGFIGITTFLISGVASITVFVSYYQLVKLKLNATHPQLLKTHVLHPYVLTQLIFTLLYFTQSIPPVPLSASYMGIFHGVEKKDGHYLLTYNRPSYKFWQHGDETFEARPGDTIVAFIQVFSPSGFKENLQVRWLYDDEKSGWQPQDAIPLAITGGREEGFRSATLKNNYVPGKWRVQIETKDGQEIGRLGFIVVADTETTERVFRSEIR